MNTHDQSSLTNIDQIIIKATPDADTRSATAPITRSSLITSTMLHKQAVSALAAVIGHALFKMQERHDHTKIEDIDEFLHDFQQVQQEQTNFCDGDWYIKHIKTERHHLNACAPADVDLIDILEYVIDNVAAGKARNGEVHVQPLSEAVMAKAIDNTATKLAEMITVVK